MVKVAEGTPGNCGFGAWRGRLLLLAGGFALIANACGGRTVWVEETGEAGESGSGGVSGHAGDSGGGYAGDYGGGGYGGSYGGSSGGYGGSYGGSSGGYGGVIITGGYAGDFGGSGGYPGGSAPGGSAGAYGGFAGSVAGKGGFAGTGPIGGTAGMAGQAGCGAASGAGGGGSTGLGKACSYFCSNYPQSCPSDWSDPSECYAQCQSGYGLGSWCNDALSNFLICMGGALNPSASCMVSPDGQCHGPGCTADAINRCYPQYQGLIDCLSNPRPPPLCPPPPLRPVPPNCGQGIYGGPDYCLRETSCPMQHYMTQCYPQFDQTWYCECYFNGIYTNTVTTDYYPDPCLAGASLCGHY